MTWIDSPVAMVLGAVAGAIGGWLQVKALAEKRRRKPRKPSSTEEVS